MSISEFEFRFIIQHLIHYVHHILVCYLVWRFRHDLRGATMATLLQIGMVCLSIQVKLLPKFWLHLVGTFLLAHDQLFLEVHFGRLEQLVWLHLLQLQSSLITDHPTVGKMRCQLTPRRGLRWALLICHALPELVVVILKLERPNMTPALDGRGMTSRECWLTIQLIIHHRYRELSKVRSHYSIWPGLVQTI